MLFDWNILACMEERMRSLRLGDFIIKENTNNLIIACTGVDKVLGY